MHEQICYQKSYLKQVIAKVDFASPLALSEKGVPTKLLNLIVKGFPIIEPAETTAHEVSIDGAEVQAKQTTTKQWNYFSKDRGRQLTVAPQTVFILYTTYTRYESMKEEFSTVLDGLSKAFPDTKVARFGLRFINHIDEKPGDPTVWSDLINPQLLGNRALFGNEDPISRLMGIAELTYDDINVRFQFGMPNPDYPAPVKRPFFVLDLDASVSQAHDLVDVSGYMDVAHEKLQTIYERSITDQLREKMDAKPVQQ